MSNQNEKFLIKIGNTFEANASGKLAIVAVLIIACVVIFAGGG